MYQLDFGPVFARADLFIGGAVVTILFAASSMAIAWLFGMLIALCRLSPFRSLRSFGLGYVLLFRGVPLYIYIFFVYYGIAGVFHINLNAIEAGVLCLATLYAAYLAEIDRAALGAIPHQQREAAIALGLSPFQSFRLIILPQALRIMLPPTTNMFAGMVMDTSLVSVIGVNELLRLVREGASDTFRTLEFYTVGAFIYLAMVLVITWFSRRFEQRVQLDVPQSVTRLLPRASR